MNGLALWILIWTWNLKILIPDLSLNLLMTRIHPLLLLLKNHLKMSSYLRTFPMMTWTPFLRNLEKKLPWTPMRLNLDLNLQFHLLFLTLRVLLQEADLFMVQLLRFLLWILLWPLSMNQQLLRISLQEDFDTIDRKLWAMDLIDQDLQLWHLLNPMILLYLLIRQLLRKTQRLSLKLLTLMKLTTPCCPQDGLLMKKATFSFLNDLWTSGKFVWGVSFDTTFVLALLCSRSRRTLILTFQSALSILMVIAWRSSQLVKSTLSLMMAPAKRLSQRPGLEWRSFRSLRLLGKNFACMSLDPRNTSPRTPRPSSIALRRRSTRVVFLNVISLWMSVWSSKKPNRRNFDPSLRIKFGNLTARSMLILQGLWPRECCWSGQRTRMVLLELKHVWLSVATLMLMLFKAPWRPRAPQRLGFPGTTCSLWLRCLAGSSGHLTSLRRFYKDFLKNENFGSSFLLNVFDFWELQKKLGCSWWSLSMANLMLQEDGTLKRYVDFVLLDFDNILDPCTFLIYETDFEDPSSPSQDRSCVLGSNRLCGMICLHVDDMLGAGDPDSPVYQDVIKRLRDMFSFREWKDGDSLEYCGATIEKSDDGTLRLHHSNYFKKVKPLTVDKHLGPESELSSQETTALRGLLGALQWPAVQSSPHLQASTSIYSGSVSRGLVKTALEANRLLKFAKDNADVGLTYSPMWLGDMRMVTAFDASFGCRPDGSSQGGYLVMLAPKKILETEEDFYHILDWRSQKLPRIARSSLAAEAQAAACASDATEFAVRYFEHLKAPDVPLRELIKLRSSLDPALITDAKALFDSYHRESLVSSVTDRRISLEIRVVKEQMESLGGSLRWVSSERQIADGLTKDSARQLFADRLRHAKVKFLFDPDYVAAKKKPLAERLQSQGEGSTSRRKKKKAEKATTLATVEEEDETTVDEIKVDVDETVTDETEVLQNDMVNGDGAYMAFSDGPLQYVNVINLLPTENLGGNCFGFMMCLVAALLTIGGYVVGYLHGKRIRDAVSNAALEGLQSAERQSNAFAVVLPHLERALIRANERIYEADPDNRRSINDRLREDIRLLRTQWADLVNLRTHANRVINRALDESTWHSDEECPFGKPVYFSQEDKIWHMSWTCSAEHCHTEAHRFMPCRICACEWHTPWVPNERTGVSLHLGGVRPAELRNRRWRWRRSSLSSSAIPKHAFRRG